MTTYGKNIIAFAITLLFFCLGVIALKEYRVVDQEMIKQILKTGLVLAALAFIFTPFR